MKMTKQNLENLFESGLNKPKSAFGKVIKKAYRSGILLLLLFIVFHYVSWVNADDTYGLSFIIMASVAFFIHSKCESRTFFMNFICFIEEPWKEGDSKVGLAIIMTLLSTSILLSGQFLGYWALRGFGIL